MSAILQTAWAYAAGQTTASRERRIKRPDVRQWKISTTRAADEIRGFDFAAHDRSTSSPGPAGISRTVDFDDGAIFRQFVERARVGLGALVDRLCGSCPM